MSSNTIPPLTPRGPYINWCEAHSTVFSANAVAIGLTTVKTAAYAQLVKDAQGAIASMESHKSAYRQSVVDAANAMRALSKNTNGTSELVRTIRAFADSSANPNAVLGLAEIDPVAPPTPAPAPFPVSEIKVGIEIATGGIVLNWKTAAAQPGAGTVYIVKRRVNSEGAWQYIGSAGSDKTFTDNTFTPGPDSVQYSITAQRSNQSSTPTAVVVNFGTGGGGEFGVSSVKMAA